MEKIDTKMASVEMWKKVLLYVYWWQHNQYIVMLMILHFPDIFISMQSLALFCIKRRTPLSREV